MNIEIILALKQRAKEMLEGNYDRKIGDEELYTIICEWENDFKLLNHMSKRFEEALNDMHLEFMLDAVMKKENISIRTLMEREMSSYYDSKIKEE